MLVNPNQLGLLVLCQLDYLYIRIMYYCTTSIEYLLLCFYFVVLCFSFYYVHVCNGMHCVNLFYVSLSLVYHYCRVGLFLKL